jgi:hypothetical protein
VPKFEVVFTEKAQKDLANLPEHEGVSAKSNNTHSSPPFDKSMNFANYSKKHTNIIFAIMMIIASKTFQKIVMLSKEQKGKR